MNADAALRVRPPHFADNRWYRADPGRLAQEIGDYLIAAPSPAFSGKIVGLVAPHAGHFFSGHVAAAAFAPLKPGIVKTVVLIGPDHHGAAPGQVSTLRVGAWRTPLGDIPVEQAVLEALHREIGLAWLERDQEHSLEIELPFLQMALEEFRLVPLLMGDQSLPAGRQLARALDRVLHQLYPPSTEPFVLLVASSDLSHFFRDDVARQLDQETLRFVLNLDAPGLIRHVEQARHQGHPLACGSGPIATVMEAAQSFGATQTHLLKYATSADVSAQKDQVVGYAALALTTGG